MRRASALALALAIAVAMGGCGSSGGGRSSAPKIGSLPADAVPSKVLDLTVAQEDVHDALSQVTRTYLDATSIYSFRSADLLQATLQLSRFLASARYQSTKFQQTLVAQIGSTSPTQVRVGDRTVYLTAGNQQRIAVWFRGRYMFVLATREDFSQPRTLLRDLLQVQPA
ncbi:MAG: hypothetical protein JOZ37_15665 [Actinobacteria bacterium]|nr:hypothetical protein [Actinomycetota bacterium]MBV9253127.1 hypothetical protein [Actinomycetota bacterium]MBV9665406.1 hypothetical protein [Actinomycetota bacterium]MBV9935892.1 hypothetical protein [Actinomycetota bacterium]